MVRVHDYIMNPKMELCYEIMSSRDHKFSSVGFHKNFIKRVFLFINILD